MYYLIGIKGTGMSALALALKSLGCNVIGSDKTNKYFTEYELEKNNISILEFNKNNIDNHKDYNFIISYAYNEFNNEEVRRLKELNIKYYYYGNFINSFFNGIKIGVSGSHGKTTVSKMISSYLDDISYIIGDGSGKAIYNSKYFLIEACEYKKHFLDYDFNYLIVNNIDYDHPDFYKNKEEYFEAFNEACNKAKCVIYNGDDKYCAKLSHSNKYSFGFNRGNFCLVKILEEDINGYKISVRIEKKRYIYKLPFFGKHMIYNFISVLLLMYLEKIDISNININNFKLPKMRMSERKFKSNILVDDYAHHPTEIKYVIKAMKQKYPNSDIITIFQPHTYSRTLELKDDFKNLFKDVKERYLLKTYTSRETYNKEKERKVKRIFKWCKYITQDDYKKISNYENKVIIFIGAGDTHSEVLNSFS